MSAEADAELEVVVAEGLVAASEARRLAAAAAVDGQRLLEHLRAAGRISDPMFAMLRGQVAARLQEVTRGLPTVRQIHVDKTLSMERGADGVPVPDPVLLDDPERFPVPNWDRYQPIRLLGQGGMGRVFLARDLRLRRNVAIKFVRGDDPDDIRRVIAEARSQARVNDERVCKVFDVGEVDGKVYIAMQHIDGRTLTDLVDDLTFEQKALVLRGAALGVNEAHRVGIIHRDLKPSNIMVERGDDGALRPYVMDFGLARDWSTSDTMTGTVLGTPQFMAPEQARGEVRQLDRRADVYSLGATLYALLTDHAPIEGGNALEILSKVSTVEPMRPRARVPGLPIDLEAIVLKCLEKDRDARYDSARALADDLGRFLAGEPVTARIVSRGYRLRKALRRHWRAVVIAGVVVAAVGAALGFALRERQQAARREALARRFTDQVGRIEAQARYAALAPIHDLGPDRAHIRAEMQALAAEIEDEGSAAEAPGHYALGRGYLALGDDAHAEVELRQAWQQGFLDPRAAYALALTEGHLYQQGLLEVELLPVELRAARRTEIEQRYRDPALAALRDADGAEVPSLPYVAALLAFYEGRLDDALAELDKIDTASTRLAWFYEAPLLRGEIQRAKVIAEQGRATPAQVAADLAAGRRAFAAAAAIGESDPAVHRALGELEDLTVSLELYGGGQVAAPFARGVAAAGRALALAPDDVDALGLRARLERRFAEHKGNRGEDASALLGQAVADAQRALSLAPARDELQLGLAQAYLQSGEDRQGRNEDPGEPLRHAVASMDAIGAPSRDANYFINVGIIHTVWADYQDQVGQDSRADRGLAIEAYRSAIQRNDRVAKAWLNLGNNYVRRAAQAHAIDADGDLRQAIDALERGRVLDPGNFAAAYFEGGAYAQLATRMAAHGADPTPDRGRAVAMYQHGLLVAPRVPHLYNGMSDVLAVQGQDAWSRGDDPDPYLVGAAAAAIQAIIVAPEQGFGYNNLGWALLQRATFDRLRGRDPTGTLDAALAAFARALVLIPDEPTILGNEASAQALAAAYQVDRGLDPRPRLSQVERIVGLRPSSASLVQPQAEALAIRARWQAGHGESPLTSLTAAAAAFRTAVAKNPDDQAVALAFAAFCRRAALVQLASGADPRATLDEGQAVVDGLLAVRPMWSTARAVRAGLEVARGQLPATTEAERTEAARAADGLAKLLAADKNLARAWAFDW
jgi:serine/threonine-protein kinase